VTANILCCTVQCTCSYLLQSLPRQTSKAWHCQHYGWENER